MHSRTQLTGYLSRLGLTARPPATLAGLCEVHRAHVARIPYDNVSIMLGRPDSVEPAASVVRAVAQRIDGPAQRTVRGVVHQVLTPAGRDQRDLTSYDEWRAALVDDLLLSMDDVTEDEWRSLWDRTMTAHRAWDEAGRL